MKNPTQDRKDALGRKITAARKAAGLSQARLAKLSNVAASSIIRWEHGEGSPQEGTLKAIARACDVPAGALIARGRKTKIEKKDREKQFRAEIAGRLRFLRGRMLQRIFAKKAGITARAYLRYEGGTRHLRDFQIRNICETCGVSADWLIFGTSRPGGKAGSKPRSNR